jgi:hypothetical protein
MPRWDSVSREKQAQRIREWQPWQNSSGPVTQEGKAIASKNRCPSDYFFFHGLEIRQDTKKGKKLVYQLMQTLALQRLNLISRQECCQRIEALLRKNGYLDIEDTENT